ncbi:MAG: hypothetical protein KJ771_01745 [Nanoarchaeota archaeon]|nr:hypothetical protein [Nanoarchaeota archaeon]
MVMPLHALITKCLEDGPKTTKELYKLMPQENRLSIRAIITLNPDKFVRITKGFVGKRGRDDYLWKYYQLFEETVMERPKIALILKCFLVSEPKTFEEICKEFPEIKEECLKRMLGDKNDFEIKENKYSLIDN